MELGYNTVFGTGELAFLQNSAFLLFELSLVTKFRLRKKKKKKGEVSYVGVFLVCC